MIFDGSRYERTVIGFAPDHNGEYRQTMFVSPHKGNPVRFREYVVKVGDRIDVLAYKHLGDSRKWWRIANLNPGVLSPALLRPGTVIRIPIQ